MTPSRLALLSVTNKDKIADFAKNLHDLGFKILSTGGTAKILQQQNIPIVEVSSWTGFPEILDGRVKTLHPKVHAGILADYEDPEHRKQLEALALSRIELVCVNLYAFEDEAVAKNLSLDEAIHHIDVGGPSMMRGAAKNHRNCMVVCDPADYVEVIQQLKNQESNLSFRQKLAAKAFGMTAQYDAMIAQYFYQKLSEPAPQRSAIPLKKVSDLRYGENPQQSATFYRSGPGSGLSAAKVLQGKELSYNNLLDLDAALSCAMEFSQPACVIVKHTNPCGVALAENISDAFSRALKSDSKSAFGGIVACNQAIDGKTAAQMSEIFFECIAAPTFSSEAKEIFAKKKNLRLLEVPMQQNDQSFNFRNIFGGVLVQSSDSQNADPNSWKCATEAKASAAEISDMEFAMKCAKHVKSNAIVLVRDKQTIGIGAGQMSRVDAVESSIRKAREFSHAITGSVCASDAFFPFADNIEILAKAGIRGVVQPGGSVKDAEVISAANLNHMFMYFSGLRHFRH